MIRLALVAVVFVATSAVALAHSSTRGFVLLLPTEYVILGGTMVVLASVVIMSALNRSTALTRLQPSDQDQSSTIIPSLISATALVLLLWVGFVGPRDPAENLLSLTIWTLWWVIIVLLHAIVGNVWAAINPFSGLGSLTARIGYRSVPFPEWLAYWPALLIYAAFAWFQLVYPGPENPPRLALIVAIYAVGTLLAISVFGHKAWLSKADPFAVFLFQVGAASPWARSGLRYPGTGLLSLAPLPAAGTLFVLLTLSSITFDGFANTFSWFAMIGVNPLDYPGRTALVMENSMGLLAFFVLLAAAYTGSIWVGWAWSGATASLRVLLGRFVFSLIPISVAYHLAHYLGDTLLNLQYTALAINDPLGSGADFLGLAGMHVTASFLNTAAGAFTIFSIQTVAIVLGHVIAVAVAHAVASEMTRDRATALKLEAPLAGLMVLYTAFGLWLLAAPAIS